MNKLEELSERLDRLLCDEDLTDEKLQEAAQSLLPNLADEMRRNGKRIEELERENKDEARLHRIAHSRCLARHEALTEKLQSARKLAEMIDGAGEYLIQQYKLEGLVDKAREFLEELK